MKCVCSFACCEFKRLRINIKLNPLYRMCVYQDNTFTSLCFRAGAVLVAVVVDLLTGSSRCLMEEEDVCLR